MDNWYRAIIELPTEAEVRGRSLHELTDLAVARGTLGTFDYAIPVGWVDAVIGVTGERPSHVVWSYPERSIFGEPFPLTREAAALVARYIEAERHG